MRYYIADCHFYHGALNERMDERGFASIEDMHEHMINAWNGKVRRGDDVVILGDFSMGNGSETMEVLARLNGNKYLIQGNHDKYLEDRKFDSKMFKWVKPYMEYKDNKRKVILSHYPVFCYNGQYRRDKDGCPSTYMLYGHVHNTFDEVVINRFINETRNTKRLIHGFDEPVSIPCQMINCFTMFSGYVPLTLDEWIKLDEDRRKNLSIKDEKGEIS